MKKIALILVAVMAISCTQNKQETGNADMKGEWKTLQTKISNTQPIHDVNCDEGKAKWNGSMYTFNPDGSFSVKDICTGKPDPDQQKHTWKFEDHILTLEYIYKGKEMRAVYSVVEMGDNKVKWKLLYTRYDGNYLMEDFGYYLVMRRQ